MSKNPWVSSNFAFPLKVWWFCRIVALFMRALNGALTGGANRAFVKHLLQMADWLLNQKQLKNSSSLFLACLSACIPSMGSQSNDPSDSLSCKIKKTIYYQIISAMNIFKLLPSQHCWVLDSAWLWPIEGLSKTSSSFTQSWAMNLLQVFVHLKKIFCR